MEKSNNNSEEYIKSLKPKRLTILDYEGKSQDEISKIKLEHKTKYNHYMKEKCKYDRKHMNNEKLEANRLYHKNYMKTHEDMRIKNIERSKLTYRKKLKGETKILSSEKPINIINIQEQNENNFKLYKLGIDNF